MRRSERSETTAARPIQRTSRAAKICGVFFLTEVRDEGALNVEPIVGAIAHAMSPDISPQSSSFMKSARLLLFAALAPFAFPLTALNAADSMPDMPGHDHQAHRAVLTDAQKKFLSSYETVRAALAVDNLAGAKAAAANIAASVPAAQLAKATSLNAARVAFKKLSEDAVQIAKGQEGFYVATCPMVGSDWVQTTDKISNPYLGREMPTCGSIKNRPCHPSSLGGGLSSAPRSFLRSCLAANRCPAAARAADIITPRSRCPPEPDKALCWNRGATEARGLMPAGETEPPPTRAAATAVL